MPMSNTIHKEGDLYKVIKVGGHTFELRFGYYADFERNSGVPVVIYPDLAEQKRYSTDGQMLVTAVQDPCRYYEPVDHDQKEECCCDCRHYLSPGDDIAICACRSNVKSP